MKRSFHIEAYYIKLNKNINNSTLHFYSPPHSSATNIKYHCRESKIIPFLLFLHIKDCLKREKLICDKSNVCKKNLSNQCLIYSN
jgi:hypothetical protein